MQKTFEAIDAAIDAAQEIDDDNNDDAEFFDQEAVIDDNSEPHAQQDVDKAVAARASLLCFFERLFTAQRREESLKSFMVKSAIYLFSKRGSIRPTGISSPADRKHRLQHSQKKHPIHLTALRLGHWLHSSVFQRPYFPHAVNAPLARIKPRLKLRYAKQITSS
ncbi:hypothetical protein PSEUBRA_003010 [Kalmanozyma brasiliensis GHG001]|uniref:uncharacterized protein n=1 Tax=Kalmanozyma brasiliensis (strain GHG001) TaxID=1365824 RepID=UPI002867C1A8|nr:uncharacterized protein PSEUBRA_003010 [Kalmanozyma brasiliensis GHG001]KAF6767165.1 hypothetical protein PSEUBRA_003010 [Kalmanozyma brasiliensis GHG001]